MFVSALVVRISSAIHHINETSGYGEIVITIEKKRIKRIRVTTTENCEAPDVSGLSERDALALLGGGGQAAHQPIE